MELAECNARARTVEAGLDQAWIEKNLDTAEFMRVYGRMVRREDMEVRCIESADQPRITEDMRSLAPSN